MEKIHLGATNQYINTVGRGGREAAIGIWIDILHSLIKFLNISN